MTRPTCWFAQLEGAGPCEGPTMVRAHLIAKQALKRRGHDPWDERAWVWACGGQWPGLGGHHGRFDSYRLRVSRESLPAALEELAADLGVRFYLDRRYGPQEAIVDLRPERSG